LYQTTALMPNKKVKKRNLNSLTTFAKTIVPRSRSPAPEQLVMRTLVSTRSNIPVSMPRGDFGSTWLRERTAIARVDRTWCADKSERDQLKSTNVRTSRTHFRGEDTSQPCVHTYGHNVRTTSHTFGHKRIPLPGLSGCSPPEIFSYHSTNLLLPLRSNVLSLLSPIHPLSFIFYGLWVVELRGISPSLSPLHFLHCARSRGQVQREKK